MAKLAIGPSKAKSPASVLAELTSATPSSYAELELQKSSLVLSKWEDDVVVISAEKSRYKSAEIRFDLTKLLMNCSGPMSIFDGLHPLTEFPNLTATTKAYLGACATAFESSSKITSEITQNLNNVVRFYLWMIKNKGVYRLSALNRTDFNDFVDDFKEKGGWYGLFSVDDGLKLILTDLKDGKVGIAEVCSSYDYSGNSKVRLRDSFLDARLGIPAMRNWTPAWFYDALLEYHDEGFTSTKGHRAEQVSYMAVYSVIKAINRLYGLPDNFDKPQCRPFPQSQRKALEVGGTSQSALRQTSGRTVNISLDDSIKIFSEATTWVYDYAPGVLAILNEYRGALEKHVATGHGDDWVTHLINEDVDLKSRVHEICSRCTLPFADVCADSHALGHDPSTKPSVDDLVKCLMTACFDLVAINHARRLNEVVGESDLPYGLYFGCIKPGQDNLGSSFIDIYVEKTVRDWSSFYVNKLVVDAVSVLEEMSQAFRPLFTERKLYLSDIALARKDKLFRIRPFTPKGFAKDPVGYKYSHASKNFMKRAGVEDIKLDGRAHPFRRLFALLYWYRYDNPKLLALQHHLRHLSPGVTAIYITDPVMRTGADSIASLYRKRIEEHTAEDLKEINDVRSEAFRDGVMRVLRGERRGGNWPKLVLKCYEQLLRSAEFRHLEFEQKQRVVAQTMEERGYSRIPYKHGGCNLGENDRTRRLARCRQADGLAHTESAAPRQCQQCFHHDSSDSHIELLREEVVALRESLSNQELPASLRAAVLEEIFLIENVIKSELSLETANRKLLSEMGASFTRDLEAVDA